MSGTRELQAGFEEWHSLNLMGKGRVGWFQAEEQQRQSVGMTTLLIYL